MTEVVTLLEDHRGATTTLFGSEPIVIQAADFGRAQSAIFYWPYDLPVDQHIQKDTYEFTPKGTTLKNVALLRYTGAKQPNHSLLDPDGTGLAWGMPTCKVVPKPGIYHEHHLHL